MKTHKDWMSLALQVAQEAALQGEVPVGALIVGPDGVLVATGGNRREQDHDPTGHAEVVALRAACQKQGDWRLDFHTLYVTLEPCPMCASAILQARLQLLVYGCDDLKAGAIQSVHNLPASPSSFHRLQVIAGVEEQACRQLLDEWFSRQRKASKNALGHYFSTENL